MKKVCEVGIDEGWFQEDEHIMVYYLVWIYYDKVGDWGTLKNCNCQNWFQEDDGLKKGSILLNFLKDHFLVM